MPTHQSNTPPPCIRLLAIILFLQIGPAAVAERIDKIELGYPYGGLGLTTPDELTVALGFGGLYPYERENHLQSDPIAFPLAEPITFLPGDVGFDAIERGLTDSADNILWTFVFYYRNGLLLSHPDPGGAGMRESNFFGTSVDLVGRDVTKVVLEEVTLVNSGFRSMTFSATWNIYSIVPEPTSFVTVLLAIGLMSCYSRVKA